MTTSSGIIPPVNAMRFLAAILSVLMALEQGPAQQRLQKLVLNVTDARGRYILNMTEKDFIVEEDGAFRWFQ